MEATMNIRISLLLVCFSFCCVFPASAQEGGKISFKLENNTLRPDTEKDDPCINKDKPFIIEVSGINQENEQWQQWTFRLGDQVAKFEKFENDVLIFKIDEVKDNRKNEYEIHFKDNSGQFQLDMDPKSIYLCVPNRPRVPNRPLRMSKSDSENITIKKTYIRSKNEINLYFNSNGFLENGKIPRDVDDNDIINLFLIGSSEDELKNIQVEIIGQLASDEDVSILGSGVLGDLKGISEGLTSLRQPGIKKRLVNIGAFGPYQGPSITIIIEKIEAGESTTLRSYSMKVNKNYIASLRFGVAKSSIRFNEYAVKEFAGSASTHIKNVSDEDGEPRHYLAIVFYGWRFWNNKFWNGRDLEEKPRILLDRINPFVGFGLKKLGDEFYYGLTFEVARGFDFSFGGHLAKTKVLNGGYSEGDIFTGQEDKLPTENKWKSRWFIGVSVDLRIVTKIIGSLFAGSS